MWYKFSKLKQLFAAKLQENIWPEALKELNMAKCGRFQCKKKADFVILLKILI